MMRRPLTWPAIIAWIVLLILVGFLLFVFTACTTIDTNKEMFADPDKCRNGAREGPPSSLNPPLEVIKKDNKQSVLKFGMLISKRIKYHKEQGHIITDLRILFYPYDGLNWKAGDIREAVIYYKVSTTN